MRNPSISKKILTVLLPTLGVLVARLSIQRVFQGRSSVQPPEPESGEARSAGKVDQSFSGLTADEVAARTPIIDLDEIRKKERRSFLRQAIYKNIFTLFNFDLIAMMVMLYLLGSTLGALGSLLVLIIAVVLNTFTKAKMNSSKQCWN